MIMQCPYLPAVPPNNLNGQSRRPAPRVQFVNINPDSAPSHELREPDLNRVDTIDMALEDMPEPPKTKCSLRKSP